LSKVKVAMEEHMEIVFFRKKWIDLHQTITEMIQLLLGLSYNRRIHFTRRIALAYFLCQNLTVCLSHTTDTRLRPTLRSLNPGVW